MDTHTTEQRHKNMQAIKCKDTKIEVLLRKELWSRGIRYRKNAKDVVGKPDIVFKGKKIAVFCDSEFWHGYNWKVKQSEIKSHREFWIPKIERNIERDEEVNAALEANGWRVLRFWGDDIKRNVKACAGLIVDALKERDR
jgi:DNA mismatch endonuclease vsr